MLINCHFADAQFRSNLPIFQFLSETEIEYLAGLWREFSIHISQNCLVLFGLPVYFGNRRFQGNYRRRSIGFQEVMNSVFHLLSAQQVEAFMAHTHQKIASGVSGRQGRIVGYSLVIKTQLSLSVEHIGKDFAPSASSFPKQNRPPARKRQRPAASNTKWRSDA